MLFTTLVLVVDTDLSVPFSISLNICAKSKLGTSWSSRLLSNGMIAPGAFSLFATTGGLCSGGGGWKH